MTDNQKCYQVDDPCFGGRPVFARWRSGVDIEKAASDLSGLMILLLNALDQSLDPYAEDGLEYLTPFVRELAEWQPKLPGEEAASHVTRVFCVLQGIHEEIDRIDDPAVNGLIQQVRGKTDWALERVRQP